MDRAELDRHKVRTWGRDYTESDDGYSDMEAEAKRGWAVLPSWGSQGWDLGHWPYVAFYTRDRASCAACGVNLTDGSGDGTGGHWANCTDPTGRFELLEIVEGDRTLWRFVTEDDRAAATDYLFLWYAAHEDRGWSPVRLEHRERLEAGVLAVDEKFRGPYRDQPPATPARPATLTELLAAHGFAAPLFPLGQLVATPAALDLLAKQGIDVTELLARHASGDWGDVDAADKTANDLAVMNGGRLLSSYHLGAGKVYVITEHDRSATTALTPEDY